MIETLDWNGGGRALVARRFGPLLSQLASFVSSRLSGDSRRRFASRHDPSLGSEAPRPLGGAHKRIGPRSSLFCSRRCCAWPPLFGLVRISGPLQPSQRRLRWGRAKAGVGWLIYDSWTVPFEGQGPLEPEKTKSQLKWGEHCNEIAFSRPLDHISTYRTHRLAGAATQCFAVLLGSSRRASLT